MQVLCGNIIPNGQTQLEMPSFRYFYTLYCYIEIQPNEQPNEQSNKRNKRCSQCHLTFSDMDVVGRKPTERDQCLSCQGKLMIHETKDDWCQVQDHIACIQTPFSQSIINRHTQRKNKVELVKNALGLLIKQREECMAILHSVGMFLDANGKMRVNLPVSDDVDSDSSESSSQECSVVVRETPLWFISSNAKVDTLDNVIDLDRKQKNPVDWGTYMECYDMILRNKQQDDQTRDTSPYDPVLLSALQKKIQVCGQSVALQDISEEQASAMTDEEYKIYYDEMSVLFGQ